MGDVVQLLKDKKSPSTVSGAQPSKKTGNGRHGMDLRIDDFYPTPAPLTKALLRAVTLPHHLWEPAAGMGHMAVVLAAAGHNVICSDLIDYGNPVPRSPKIQVGKDFMDPAIGLATDVDAIVTNPPFSLSAQFVRQGLRFASDVYILNRLAFLEGKARRDIFDKHLEKVLIFENRPPMMHRWSYNEAIQKWEEWAGKKSDSAMAMAWFHFARLPSKPATLHRIRWEKSDL